MYLSQYRHYDTGWMSSVKFLAGGNYGSFSLHRRVHTGSGVHAASYPMDTGCKAAAA
jgi:hypothetical protein